MHSALTNCQEKIEKFGGHSMAVGLQVNKDEINSFRDLLNEEAKKREIEKIEPVVEVNQELSLEDLNKQVVQSLDLLEPYGEANKKMIFLFKNMQIQQIRTLSEGKHIKLSLKSDKMIVDAIGFGMGHFAAEYKIGEKIDCIGNIEINKFGSYENIQIGLVDMRNS